MYVCVCVCVCAAVLRAPILFFDSNPLGRILNRFSKDMGFLDDMYVCVCVSMGFTLFSKSISLGRNSLSLLKRYGYVYLCVGMCVCVCMFNNTHTHRLPLTWYDFMQCMFMVVGKTQAQHVHTHTHTHTHIHTYVRTYVHTFTHVYMPTNKFKRAYMYINKYECNSCILTQHTHTHAPAESVLIGSVVNQSIHTHTHTHTRTRT